MLFCVFMSFLFFFFLILNDKFFFFSLDVLLVVLVCKFIIISKNYFLQTIKKIVLCNKGMKLNLYKLHFLSFNISSQPNKEVFHPFNFLFPQPNTHEGRLNLVYFIPPVSIPPPFYPLTEQSIRF